MKKIKLSHRLRYYFENTLSTGPSALIKWLGILSLIIILVCALLIVAFRIKADPDGQPLGFAEGVWQSLMATIDSGAVGGDAGWAFRTVRMIATFGGIFIISVLIGTIGSTIDVAIEELKKGRSEVMVSQHTLILGWSEKIFGIITEICHANLNQVKPTLVVMAARDKGDMEDAIRAKVKNRFNTKIIVRSGSPLEPTNISIVNPDEARSIIVLSSEEGNSDTHDIKTVLALTNGKNRKKESYNIVAEIKDPANMEAAELVGGEEAVFVLSSDIISRVTAQTCRQSGLSIVYTGLLGFDGDEIYFQEEPALVGKTYRDALLAYDKSAVIGLYTNEKEVLINPPMDRIIQMQDQVIAISEDDDTVVLSEQTEYGILDRVFSNPVKPVWNKEKTLILGWNDRGPRIVEELDHYVADESQVHILADLDDFEKEIAALQTSLQRQTVTAQVGNTNDRATLELLHPEDYDHIIILSYTDGISAQESDARTLISLLHLRNLSEQVDRSFSIVTEMLDIRNRELAEVTKADDFIVSDNLVSLMVSQLSENRELKKVYDILFQSAGSEIYLKPIGDYVQLGNPLNYYTVVASAARFGETAIGYRIQHQSYESEYDYGVKMNPDKNALITFSPEDKIIVLAEA